MAIRWAVTGGTWSSTSTWNDGATLGIPTVGDDVFTNGFTVNMNVNATVNSLNNSARSRTIATPIMTSDNSSIGNSFASSNAGSSFLPYLAFDQNTGSRWLTNSESNGHVGFSFLSSIVISTYSFVTTDVAVSGFTFQGSNDGLSWTTLHSAVQTVNAGVQYTSPENINTTSYFRYRIIISNTSVGTTRIAELYLYPQYSATIAAGGSFNFNTAGVTVTCTSTSASLSSGQQNIITVTAPTGTVTLNLSSNVTGGGPGFNQIINHTGNCNLNLSGLTFVSGFVGGASCINKTGAGSLSIVGNLIGGTGAGGSGLLSNNGNIIITGNVIGVSTAGAQISNGTLTMVGNITGGAGATGLVHSGPSAIITGNVIGGSTNTNGIGLSASAPTTINGNIFGGSAGFGVSFFNGLTVNGNVFGSNVQGIISSLATTVTINGDVTSSVSANAIVMSNASAVVNLTGNMYNTLGRMAIWCPNVFISNTATTLWRMDIGGGLTRTLYSADSFPNLPSTSNVRNLIQYGPASGLTGTMIVASPSDIRRNVLTDNTVGTADITAQDILNFINTSSDPLAVRMRTMLTDNSAGQLISKYNFI